MSDTDGHHIHGGNGGNGHGSSSAGNGLRAAGEYRRALHDYTQLTRRRLANPLTAIAAGVATLRELDDQLDDEVRHELLASLERTARQLEVSVLHPELGIEDGADGSLLGLDAQTLADLVVADAVEAEQHARTLNERLFAQVAQSPDTPIRFLCECWAMECTEQVTMTLADYFIVHARHDQFVIAPHHDLPTVEHVTERRDGWWVVRKTPQALRTALERSAERVPGRHGS